MLAVSNLTGFGAGGGSTIQFVGSKATGYTGGTNGIVYAIDSGLTGGIDTAVRTGDLIVAIHAVCSSVDRTLSISDGATAYTLIGSELYSNLDADTNLRVAYKISTGDTTVSFGPSGSTSDGQVLSVFAFRGVDIASPIDVAATATGTGATTSPNPPSITPTAPGAIIMAVGAGANWNYSTQTTTNSSLTSVLSRWSTDDSGDVIVGAGLKIDWASGPFDPSAFVCSPSFTGSWAALTFSLRPA